MRGYYDEAVPVGGRRVHGRRHRTHRHREERRMKRMVRLQAAYPTVVGRRPRTGMLLGSGLAFLLGVGAIGYTIKRRNLRGGLIGGGLNGLTNVGTTGVASTTGVAPIGVSSRRGLATTGISGRIPTSGFSTGIANGVPTSGLTGIPSTGISTGNTFVNNAAPITTGIAPSAVKRGFLRSLLPFGRSSPLKSSLRAAPFKAISTPGMSIPTKRSKLPLLVALLPLLALGGLAFGLKDRLRRRGPKPIIVAPAAPATIIHNAPAPVAVPVPAPVIGAPLIKKRRLPLLRIRKTNKMVPVQQTVVEQVVEPVANVQPVARPVAVRHHVKALYPAVEEFSTDEDVTSRPIVYGRVL